MRDPDFKKPLMDFSSTMKRFSWSTYFLIASAILLGNALTNESTGVSAFLNTVLMPVLQNVPASRLRRDYHDSYRGLNQCVQQLRNRPLNATGYRNLLYGDGNELRSGGVHDDIIRTLLRGRHAGSISVRRTAFRQQGLAEIRGNL